MNYSPKRNQSPKRITIQPKRKNNQPLPTQKQTLTNSKKTKPTSDLVQLQNNIQAIIEQTPFKVLSQIKFMIKPHERIINTFRIVFMLYNHYDPILLTYFTIQNITWREISRILTKINLPLLLLSYSKLQVGKQISIQQLTQCESLLAKCQESQDVNNYKDLKLFCNSINQICLYTIQYLYSRNVSSETTKESVSTKSIITSSQLVKQSESDEEEADEPMNLKVEMEDLNKSLEKHPSVMRKNNQNQKKTKVDMILNLRNNGENRESNRSRSILKTRQKPQQNLCREKSMSKSNQSFSDNMSTQRNTSSKKSIQRTNDQKVSQWSGSKEIKRSGQKEPVHQSSKALVSKKSTQRFK